MKRLKISLLAGLLAAVLCSSVNSFQEDYDHLREGMLRLHVLANSDSPEDQAVKLKVRDAVLAETSDWFKECGSIYETEEMLSLRLPEIRRIAEQTLRDNGFSDPVACELVHMDFDRRQYENFTVPKGDYDALRITIGEAAGHNWWCVLYPPLCVPAAMDSSDLEEAFTPEELDILCNPQKYEVKFKCVEWYQAISKKLEDFLHGED